jgi:hypothetical protein
MSVAVLISRRNIYSAMLNNSPPSSRLKECSLHIAAAEKVAAEWFALLLHLSEVPGSNLGPETDYTD